MRGRRAEVLRRAGRGGCSHPSATIFGNNQTECNRVNRANRRVRRRIVQACLCLGAADDEIEPTRSEGRRHEIGCEPPKCRPSSPWRTYVAPVVQITHQFMARTAAAVRRTCSCFYIGIGRGRSRGRAEAAPACSLPTRGCRPAGRTRVIKKSCRTAPSGPCH